MQLITPSLVDFIGYLGGAGTTIAFIPQAWITWKTKRADEVSISMYSIFTLGVIFWLLYGLLIHSLPTIIANSITLVLAIYILTVKLHSKNNTADGKRL